MKLMEELKIARKRAIKSIRNWCVGAKYVKPLLWHLTISEILERIYISSYKTSRTDTLPRNLNCPNNQSRQVTEDEDKHNSRTDLSSKKIVGTSVKEQFLHVEMSWFLYLRLLLLLMPRLDAGIRKQTLRLRMMIRVIGIKPVVTRGWNTYKIIMMW